MRTFGGGAHEGPARVGVTGGVHRGCPGRTEGAGISDDRPPSPSAGVVDGRAGGIALDPGGGGHALRAQPQAVALGSGTLDERIPLCRREGRAPGGALEGGVEVPLGRTWAFGGGRQSVSVKTPEAGREGWRVCCLCPYL